MTDLPSVPLGRSRPPAVAGAFYPAEPDRLAHDVDRRLARAAAPVAARHRRGRHVRAIVVPHAGYIYSGDVAARAYALIRIQRPARVVVAGPAHFVGLLGVAVPGDRAWTTPLGAVPVAEDLRTVAVEAGALVDDRVHAREHAVEVQVPFLQRVGAAELEILPVAVGETEPGEVARLLARLAAVADLIVISTDLSHYLAEPVARRRDERTVRSVLRGDPGAIGEGDACGVFALRGLTAWARDAGLEVRLLDRRTSADAGGDPDRVVGYAALAIG